jgi:hypothetical protein
MQLVSAKAINWFFDLNTAEKEKLPFQKIDGINLDCSFSGKQYFVKAGTGFFSKPDNGAVFRINPELNRILLNVADTSRN